MNPAAVHTVLGKRPIRLLRQVVVASAICLVIYYCLVLGQRPGLLDSSSLSSWPQQQQQKQVATPSDADGVLDEVPSPPPPSPELLENRSLTEEQCRAQFPGLFKEIDDAVARGPFPLRPRNQTGHLGPLIARIRGGKLSILAYQRKVDLSKDMLQHRSATLHQIANALLTWPPASSSSAPPPPDTIIAFNHHDDPLPGTWSYSRPADPALLDTAGAAPYFPIPHFAFYAWPVATIASLGHAAARIDALEAGSSSSSWSSKIPRAVWRGTARFNNARAGRARQNLLHATRGEEAWADVEALSPSPSPSRSGSGSRYSNALDMADFCRYRYVIYTEGVTYSGRLPFHQLCRSVLLTPPIAWLQPTTHLVRPVFSHALPGVERSAVPTSGTPKPVSADDDDDDDDDDDEVESGDGDVMMKRRGFGYGDEDEDDSSNTANIHIDTDTTNTTTSSTNPNPNKPLLRQRRQKKTIKESHDQKKQPPLAPYPAPWVQSAWPRSYAPSEANAVFVAPDWSDLKATVAWLEAHPDVAEGIAGRQRALFSSSSSPASAAGAGYLSPAAEACYWRGLIRGWAGVAVTQGSGWDDDDEDGGYNAEGIPWEEFSLEEIHK